MSIYNEALLDALTAGIRTWRWKLKHEEDPKAARALRGRIQCASAQRASHVLARFAGAKAYRVYVVSANNGAWHRLDADTSSFAWFPEALALLARLNDAKPVNPRLHPSRYDDEQVVFTGHLRGELGDSEWPLLVMLDADLNDLEGE